MQNKVHLKVNDENQTEHVVPWESIIKRSKLFKEVYESCEEKKEVRLKLERPDKFSVILAFIMYGKMAEELSALEVFSSYINDAVYLGIFELEEHFVNLIAQVFREKKSDQMDFSISPPCKDFMERLLREKKELLLQHQYDMLNLLLKWLKEVKLDYGSVKSFAGFPFQVSKLSVYQIQDLQSKFSQEFEYLISTNSVVETFLSRLNCCKRKYEVFRAATIGNKKCYKCLYNTL